MKFYAAAFEADPRVVEDRSAWHRYTAAGAAALAGNVARSGAPALDKDTRVRMRNRALEWLKGELSSWSRLVAEGDRAACDQAASALNHWKRDSDLAGVREGESPVEFPEVERQEWQRFWADVDALLDKAKAPTPKP